MPKDCIFEFTIKIKLYIYDTSQSKKKKVVVDLKHILSEHVWLWKKYIFEKIFFIFKIKNDNNIIY